MASRSLVVPFERLEVHEHGATGVGDVGGMHPGELPDQPRVDGPKRAVPLATASATAGTLSIIQRTFGTGEVGGKRKAGLGPETVGTGFAAKLAAEGVGAGVLPHDGGSQRGARLGVPHHRGLPLVGDADGDKLLGPMPAAAKPSTITLPVLVQISSASCSTQPGFG